ncbi:MAG: hypothetical protein FAZ92_00602 [Accumulibacter sp.]|nr:MAG: hypothetical protein FAZ92_00602 [Accumulibacter sp.]
MAPGVAPAVREASGEPAVQFDAAGEERREQRADGLAAAHFVAAERARALEAEDADAEPPVFEDDRADGARAGEVAVGDGDAAVRFVERRLDDAAPLVEGFVHGVFEGGDEVALLFEEGGVRQGEQARLAAAVDAERDAVAGEAAGEVVDHRQRQVRQPFVFGGDGEDVECAARALDAFGVGDALPAQEERLDPADAPVQLSQNVLQCVVGALGEVEDDGTVQAPFEFDRVGDDDERAGLSVQHLALAFAEASFGSRCEVADVGLRRRPDGGRDEGAAALFEQQQGGLNRFDLQALQRQPAAAEVGSGGGRGEGGPGGTGIRSPGLVTGTRCLRRSGRAG